jgi:hypothetical protein
MSIDDHLTSTQNVPLPLLRKMVFRACADVAVIISVNRTVLSGRIN